jgi:MoaA/NifB/PqqE/SkfB family radical SAM enzyme
MFDFDYVKRQIDFEYEYGIRDFEITGGEPSEYDFLPEVCDYISNKDANTKIAVITNGGLWNKPIWNKIDEVLVSYHLSKSPSYVDKYMFPLGTTYDKVSKTVEYARLNDVLVRTNTVLGSFNLYDIENIVSDLISFKPRIINFLPVNLFDEAREMTSYIDY